MGNYTTQQTQRAFVAPTCYGLLTDLLRESYGETVVMAFGLRYIVSGAQGQKPSSMPPPAPMIIVSTNKVYAGIRGGSSGGASSCALIAKSDFRPRTPRALHS